MINDEDDTIFSKLCHVHRENGKEVDVGIYGDGEGKWILAVTDQSGNSMIGDDLFDTEMDALNEFKKDIKELGIGFFIRP